MASTWIANGPVALPPRSLAYSAGAVIAAMALVGVGLGFKAAWREPAAPGSTADSQTAAGDLTAHPIVDLPAPVTAPAPDQAAADARDDAAADAEDANKALADKAAAAQALQSTPDKAGGNIDDILTSPQEKPPAPMKSQADEAPPPNAPVKSDVPF